MIKSHYTTSIKTAHRPSIWTHRRKISSIFRDEKRRVRCTHYKFTGVGSILKLNDALRMRHIIKTPFPPRRPFLYHYTTRNLANAFLRLTVLLFICPIADTFYFPTSSFVVIIHWGRSQSNYSGLMVSR